MDVKLKLLEVQNINSEIPLWTHTHILLGALEVPARTSDGTVIPDKIFWRSDNWIGPAEPEFGLLPSLSEPVLLESEKHKKI